MSLDTAGCLAGLGTMFISCNFLHLRFSEILPDSEGGCCFPSHVRLYLSLLTGDSTSPMSLVQWEKIQCMQCGVLYFHVFEELLAFVATTSSYNTEGLKPCGLVS